MGGELVSLIISLAQEIGIVAGVGAVTLTLIGHLLSLHAKHNETTRGYVRAAHHLRAFALFVIVVSGAAAVALHLVGGTAGVLVMPAFLFKWMVIILLAVLHFTEWRVTGVAQDAVEGFEGANWYALFIVHTLAPDVSWTFLLTLYAGWIVTFGVLWAVFVWIMRGQSTLKRPPVVAAKPAPAQQAKLQPEPKPVPPPVAQHRVPPAPKPAVASAASKPAPTPKIEVHPNHTLLPMVAELDLPAPSRVEASHPRAVVPAPAPKPAPVPPPAPKPVPAPPPPPYKPQAIVEVVPESSVPSVPMPGLDETGLPALHVMPRRPEDIGGSKRGPVVKMGEE